MHLVREFLQNSIIDILKESDKLTAVNTIISRFTELNKSLQIYDVNEFRYNLFREKLIQIFSVFNIIVK